MKKQIIKDSVVFLVFYVFSGILSVYLGVERALDTRNYHIYNPWALLNGRLSIDLLPASKESYFNPLLDIPYYLAIRYLNDYPNLVTFLMGFSYALFLFIIFKIANLVFQKFHKNLMTIFSVIMAGSVGLMVDHIGGLSHDIFIGDLMLIVLYLFLKAFDGKYHPRLFLSAGLIGGMAFGFKYSTIIYIIPLVIAFLLLFKSFEKPIRSLFLFAIGGGIGFLITNGWWMYLVWKTLDNPMFPYFNTFFNSPYTIEKNTFSHSMGRHIPEEWVKIWFYPFFFRFGVQLKWLEILFFSNLLLLPIINRQTFRERFKLDVRLIDFMSFFAFGAFAMWVNTFGVPRYLAPVCGLVGIIGIVVILKFVYVFIYRVTFLRIHINSSMMLGFLMSIMVCLVIVSFGNLWNSRYQVMRVPKHEKLLYVEDMKIPDDAIVLTGVGVGIIIPFQNPKASYIKNTNIYSKQVFEDISKKIAQQPDKIYLLSEVDAEQLIQKSDSEIKELIKGIRSQREKKKIDKAVSSFKRLKKFGVDPLSLKCQRIHNNFVKDHEKEPFYLCKADMI